MPKFISTAPRRPRSSKSRGRATSPSSSPRSARPIRCQVGASASRSATAADRGLERVKSYLDYGAFAVRWPPPPRSTARRNASPRSASVTACCTTFAIDGLRRTAEVYRPRRLDVRLGADPGGIPQPRHARPFSSSPRARQCRGRAGVFQRRHGGDFVRIALVENRQRLRQASAWQRRFPRRPADRSCARACGSEVAAGARPASCVLRDARSTGSSRMGLFLILSSPTLPSILRRHDAPSRRTRGSRCVVRVRALTLWGRLPMFRRSRGTGS